MTAAWVVGAAWAVSRIEIWRSVELAFLIRGFQRLRFDEAGRLGGMG